MTSAPINMGTRAAIYQEPLVPDRGRAVPGAACGPAINASIAISPPIVLKKPPANGPSRARDGRSAPAHASLS